MFDTENFQPLVGKAVKNQIAFKIIHTPRADVFQICPAKFPQPPFERLQRQALNRPVNRLKKPARGGGVVVIDVLEVAERIQFGGVADEDSGAIHAARAAK